MNTLINQTTLYPRQHKKWEWLKATPYIRGGLGVKLIMEREPQYYHYS